jgi:hypothetical protein
MPPAPSRPAPAALARWHILRGATAMMVLTGLCAPRGNEARPVRDVDVVQPMRSPVRVSDAVSRTRTITIPPMMWLSVDSPLPQLLAAIRAGLAKKCQIPMFGFPAP